MGYQQDRHTGIQCLESIEDLTLGRWIEIGGWFVEDQDPWFADSGTRQPHAL